MIWPNRRVDRHLRVLTDADWRRRRLAAGALGRLGDQRAIGPLGRALTDRRAEVRASAARALGRLGEGLVVVPLLAALPDPSRTVNRALLGALIRLGDRRVVSALLPLLAAPDPSLRADIAAALGLLGDPAALVPLLAAFRRGGLPARVCRRAFGRLCAPSVFPVLCERRPALTPAPWGPFGVMLADPAGGRGPLAELALTAADPGLRQRAAVVLTARGLAWLAADDARGAANPALPAPVRDFFRALGAWYRDERRPAGEPAVGIEQWWRSRLASRPWPVTPDRWRAVAG